MPKLYEVKNEENKTLLFRDMHISGKNKRKQGSNHQNNQIRCYSVWEEESWIGRGTWGVSRGLMVFNFLT